VRFRSSEWLLIAYFAYVAIVASSFISPWKPLALLVAVLGVLWAASTRHSWFRDVLPLILTLVAFREMDWFTPAIRHRQFEPVWIRWDRRLLHEFGLRAAIERAGPALPFFFELCYLLVYSTGFVALGILAANGKRDRINRLWLAYLAGTLGAYALFPFFPSEPPRLVFPDADLPMVSLLRRLNLAILGNFTIHSSVFPSAHVSSAISAGWGLLATLPPQRRWMGWALVAYGLCVGIAAIYGRYHYAVDALAGIAISFLGLLAAVYRNKRGA